MAFKNLRWPTDARIGMSWMPESGVSVLRLGGGGRAPQQNWARELWRARVEHVESGAAVARLLALLRVIHFERDSFRVRQPAEYQVARTPFATGSGAEQSYQLSRRFSFAGLDQTYSVDRDVWLPVEGTVRVWADDVELTETTHFTLDYTQPSGVLTTTAALGDISGQALEWSGQEDLLMALAAPPNYGSISTEAWNAPGIELVEDRP